jgi:hypothetical protein
MFEVLTTDEFAAWFAALPDRPAEEVATVVGMLEELGLSRTMPGSSDWLLWYEHREAPEPVLSDDWAPFHQSTKELVAEFETPAFAAKLRALTPEDEGRMAIAIEALRRAHATRKAGLAMAVGGPAREKGDRNPYASLHRALRNAVNAAGLAVTDRALPSSGLRELTLQTDAGRYRLLYGVDLRRAAALMILGEGLDRAFYGDSVRRAERVWKEFLQGKVETRAAPSR